MPTERTSRSEKPLEARRDQAPETLRVWLLGGFQVTVGARRIEQSEWRLKKAIALVKLLALAPGHRLHREQAMDLLWLEANRKAASNNLRTTLHATRKILDSIEGSRYLASQDDSLVLCPQGSVLVDHPLSQGHKRFLRGFSQDCSDAGGFGSSPEVSVISSKPYPPSTAP